MKEREEKKHMKKRFVDPEKKVGRKRNSLYEQGDISKKGAS